MVRLCRLCGIWSRIGCVGWILGYLLTCTRTHVMRVDKLRTHCQWSHNSEPHTLSDLATQATGSPDVRLYSIETSCDLQVIKSFTQRQNTQGVRTRVTLHPLRYLGLIPLPGSHSTFISHSTTWVSFHYLGTEGSLLGCGGPPRTS